MNIFLKTLQMQLRNYPKKTTKLSRILVIIITQPSLFQFEFVAVNFLKKYFQALLALLGMNKGASRFRTIRNTDYRAYVIKKLEMRA